MTPPVSIQLWQRLGATAPASVLLLQIIIPSRRFVFVLIGLVSLYKVYSRKQNYFRLRHRRIHGVRPSDRCPLTRVLRNAIISVLSGHILTNLFQKNSLCEWALLKDFQGEFKGQAHDQTEWYHGGGIGPTFGRCGGEALLLKLQFDLFIAFL